MQDQPLQAKIQIFTKPPFRHAALKILIGGGDDPDIDGRGAAGSHTIECPILQHPQQFALMVETQIADLIQKDSSLMREFEIAFPIRERAGETSAHMAEQFTLKEFR